MFVLTSENWTLPMQINCKIFTFCRIGLIPSYIPNTQYVSVQKVLIRFGFIGHFQLEFEHVTCLALTGFHYLLLVILGKAEKSRQGKINQGLFDLRNMFLHVPNWLLHGKYIFFDVPIREVNKKVC